MKKYVVYREVTAIYGTIVEADSEEDAYELVDDENNKTDSENPERKWIKVNRTEKLSDDSPEEFSEKNKFHLTIDAQIKGIPVPNADSLQEAIDMADDVESGQMEAIDDTLNYEFDKDFTMNTNTNKGMKQ